MSKRVLSIEQMRHLQELGVDTSKASMFYVPKLEPKNEYCLLNVKPNPIIPYIPTFTLQDIIEMLPKEIGENTGEYLISTKLFIGQTDYNEWVFEYVGLTCIKKLFTDKDIMEAAYQMLCWCIENGYIKKEDE